jgi:hypothetical protein
MKRALNGSRFSTTAVSIEDLRPIAGQLRAHRVALETAHMELARDLARLVRDREREEIGEDGYHRKVGAVRQRAEATVREHTEKIRQLRSRAVEGFETRWNAVSVLIAKASKDGNYAQYLKALPDDARKAEVQRLIHARDVEKIALAAAIFEDLRPEIVQSVPLPEIDEAKAFVAAAEREYGWANAYREKLLKGDGSPLQPFALHNAQAAAMQRFGASDAEAVEKASLPRTDESIADWRQARERQKQIEAEIAKGEPAETTEQPTVRSAPSGRETMKAALNAAATKE